MSRLLRWRVIFPAVVLLVVAAVVGIKFYTRSGAAARMVGEKLEARLGAVTKFDRLSVGLSSTSLSDLRVYEPGSSQATEPVLAAGEVDVNVGALGAAGGQDPTEIHFRDAQVLLRFNHDGDLVTRLPQAGADGGTLPTIRIESGALTIRQEGREDSVFTGIDLTIAETDHVIRVTGKVEGKTWGTWTADGAIPTGKDTKAGHLTLATVHPQPVDPELLRRVPFVNPNAWKHVTLAGVTPAKLELTNRLPLRTASTAANNSRLASALTT